jgi:uncharacterized phage infection (PIP) family protein YhgE
MALTEAQEKDLLDKVTQIEDLQKKIKGQEDLIQKFKSEQGDTRKEAAELKTLMAELKDIKDKIVLDTTTKKEDKGDESAKKISQESAAKENAKVKSRFTPEEQKIVDGRFNKLSPEDKLLIQSDPFEEKKFLDVAVSSLPKAVPDSLFKKAASSSTEDTIDRYRKIFENVEREASYIPGGRSGSPSTFSGSSPHGKDDKVIERRLPGGVIPRPTVSQKTQ